MIHFAGGGTGGHLFPALAINEALDVPARFLCSSRSIDAKILAEADVEYTPLPAIAPSVKKAISFGRAWMASVRMARERIRRDDWVVAMGGFVAAPCVAAARANGARVLLVNLDAVPGKANRWIAKRADRIMTTLPANDWEVIGPLIRRDAREGDLDVPEGKRLLFVTGGSQGAASVNDIVTNAVRESPGSFEGWQVLHQAGDVDLDAIRKTYAEAGIEAHVEPFLRHMGGGWKRASLAVSRAGAGSVCEAWLHATPTLFLPYPWHTDEHQRHNAEVLGGGCAIVTDRGDNAEAKRVLLGLVGDEARRDMMRASLRQDPPPTDGVERVLEVLGARDA